MKCALVIVLALIALVLILFAVSNRASVSLALWPLPGAAIESPLYLLVLADRCSSGLSSASWSLGSAASTGAARRGAAASASPCSSAEIEAERAQRAAARRARSPRSRHERRGQDLRPVERGGGRGGGRRRRAPIVGFVFYPPSPRSVTPGAGGGAGAPACRPGSPRRALRRCRRCGDRSRARRRRRSTSCSFTAARRPIASTTIKRRFGRKVMKAIQVAARDDVAAATRYVGVADWLLFDAKPPRQRRRAARRQRARLRLATARRRRRWRLPWMLSGGLTAENSRRGGARFRAPRRSMSRRASSAARRQGPAKIRAFLDGARRCDSL